jgi:hypothetical protein
MATFYDNEGREWLAENVGRTSGILSPKDQDPAALAPHDIIRFSSTTDDGDLIRETTLQVGTFGGLSQEEFLKLLDSARKIP